MSNALNKSMVSGWAQHQPSKRSKLNLNASTPTSAPSSGAEDSGPSNEAGPSTSSSAVKRRARPSASSGDPSIKRQKSSASTAVGVGGGSSSSRTPPEARLSSLGGLTGTIEKLLELVALPLLHPELYYHTGVAPPRGVLLHGPPGCGKTAIANALAGVGLAHPLTGSQIRTLTLRSRLSVRNWACLSSASQPRVSSAACLESLRRPCGRRLRRRRSVLVFALPPTSPTNPT